VVILRKTLKEDFNDLYKKDKFINYFNSGINNEFGSLTIINKKNNKIVGWTRLYSFKEEELSVKIGFTFIGKEYWGTNINYNVKKLILDYVFSFLTTVYFDIFENNIRSQKSVIKLGGILNKINSNKHEYILTKKDWLKKKEI